VTNLTVGELAAKLRASPHYVETLLVELADDGIVERKGDLWRLTLAAEAMVGAALRGLVDDGPEGDFDGYTSCRRGAAKQRKQAEA